MSQITAALDHLRAALTTEIATMQTRLDQAQAQLADLRTEDAGTKAALTEALTQLQHGAASIEAMASELDANDAPTEPTQPEQPTPDTTGNPNAEPVDPDPVIDQPADTYNPNA